MPLKAVGDQVIEETQSAQPHRHRSQSASPAESREERAREEGSREGERPNYKGTFVGGGLMGVEMGTQRRHRVGDREPWW